MVNRVSSSFPKGGHSATQTENKNDMNAHKVKRHRNCNTKTHNKTTALERSVMNYWGVLTSFTGLTSPSVSKDMVENIKLLFSLHDNPLTR